MPSRRTPVEGRPRSGGGAHMTLHVVVRGGGGYLVRLLPRRKVLGLYPPIYPLHERYLVTRSGTRMVQARSRGGCHPL